MELLDTGPRVHVLPAAEPRRGESSLTSLGRSGLADRFHTWHGASGRRHFTSVFRVDRGEIDSGLPSFDRCIVVPVARHGDDRHALAICIIERGSDRRAVLAFAAMADEWHVHLLGRNRGDRAAVAGDLRARHAPQTIAARFA